MNRHSLSATCRSLRTHMLAVAAVAVFANVHSAHAQYAPHQHRVVSINGVQLSDSQIAGLDRITGSCVQSASYWYDSGSGAWGYAGGPTQGFITAGLNFSRQRPVYSPRFGTGVYVNGRELDRSDVLALQRLLGTVYRGSYWLDQYGNYGRVGGRALGNLYAARGGNGGQRRVLSTRDILNTGIRSW